MRAAQPGEGHGLPHDLSDTSSAQQNPMDYDRTSIDADFPLIDARKLCILGLPWDTTDEELQHYFGQFGPLEVSKHLPGMLSHLHRHVMGLLFRNLI